MYNIQFIYPTENGVVTEVMSLEDAILTQEYIASHNNHVYESRQAVIDDILCCPTASRTRAAIGTTVVPYSK